MLGSLVLFLRISRIDIGEFFGKEKLRGILILTVIIILSPALTLIYSDNPEYGALKILNFVIGSVPAVLGAYLLLNMEWNKRLFITTLILISLIIAVVLVAVVMVKPIDQSTMYEYESGRWSHVFIGRLVSFLTLILFIILLSSRGKLHIVLVPVITAGFFLLFLTAHRAAIIGFILGAAASSIYFIITKRLTINHYTALLSIIILSTVLIYTSDLLFPLLATKTPERFEKMLTFDNIFYGGDEAITARMHNYQLAWEMFKDSPVLGNGYGSFKGYNNIKWADEQKYPHNIILEILAEFGIVGLFFFSYILIMIVRSIFNFNSANLLVSYSGSQFFTFSISLFILFLFSLWLAMFSKDLSSQSFLWMFLAVVGIGERQE